MTAFVWASSATTKLHDRGRRGSVPMSVTCLMSLLPASVHFGMMECVRLVSVTRNKTTRMAVETQNLTRSKGRVTTGFADRGFDCEHVALSELEVQVLSTLPHNLYSPPTLPNTGLRETHEVPTPKSATVVHSRETTGHYHAHFLGRPPAPKSTTGSS
ncbi:hypothetical protein BDN67DRAFT_796571 [Paxillus ammoniavirescens]|nr:hypothetical protein BDN67DRAFT_796571 [Paxillus ammoniavirescens]